MRKRIFCRGFCLLFVLLMLAGIIPPKAFAETETAAPINLSGENFEYFDSETGYAAIIIDDLGLLKEGEGEKLLENMKPLTQFGNVAFWSTDEYTYNEVEQARLKRRSLFGLTSATIFVVNMNVRKISIQSYGLIEESINSSYANTITNNVRGYATRGDYCGAASNAYNQIL